MTETMGKDGSSRVHCASRRRFGRLAAGAGLATAVGIMERSWVMRADQEFEPVDPLMVDSGVHRPRS